jgi:hypothetical protein
MRQYDAENVASPLLPGGNLIAAALDRQVMIWSDRGGASRHIGDRWAIRSDAALREAVGSDWPVPHAPSFRLDEVIRLDDVPEVAREANLHHLENPDFLLVGERADHAVLQAADAKFAADRIKPSQVSADVVSNLLAIEGGAATRLVDETVRRLGLIDPEVARGLFIAPRSSLTEHLLRRVTTGRRATVDPAEVVTVPAAPATMFAGLPPARAIGPLARIDALPVTPRTNLISAIYYFRLACACFFLWGEGTRPLLSNRLPDESEPGMVTAEVTTRAQRASSAYGLVDQWAADVEPTVRARAAVAAVATLPVRMRDIRDLVERAGIGDNKALRTIRRDLELAFRERLLERTGEIDANDPRPLAAILEDVARAARGLGPELYRELDELVARRTAHDVVAAGE